MRLLPRQRRRARLLKSAPTTIQPAMLSETLAEKYQAQVEWMRRQGIAGAALMAPREPIRIRPAARSLKLQH